MNLPLNRLEPSEIQQLDAINLVRLLHLRALLCEARHHHLKAPDVLVP